MRRRIFYLITELDPGGAERALFRLATGLDRSQYDVKVACLMGEGEVGQRLRNAGIDVLYLGMRSWCAAGAAHWRDLAALKKLRTEMRRWRPHILHTFLFHANLAGRIVGRVAGVPYIINSVRVEEPRRSHLWLDRCTQRFTDLEVCVSESARRFTAQRARVAESKLAVVPNGVELSEFESIPSAPPAWRLGVGEKVVATVGRLAEQKDPYTFLCAAYIVLRELPDTRFVIAGDGPLRNALETRARELGIAERVTLLGRIPDSQVRSLLARCDVFALSSRWEGMPNSLLEAMACRRPVVATDAGGCSEVVKDGVSGFLVPTRHAKALAARVAELLRDAQRATAMGEAGRRLIEEAYTVEHVTDQWLTIYNRAFSSISPERRT